MWKLVMLITPQTEKYHEVGEAWDQAGAPGITYIESHGLHTLKQEAQRHEILPGMFSLMEIMRQRDQNSLILFSVVQEHVVAPLVAATQSILGDLDEPNNGVLFIIAIEQAFGVRHID